MAGDNGSDTVRLIIENGHRRYTLVDCDEQTRKTGYDFWLYNEDGEGMTVATEELFQLLDKHFRENF